MRSLLCLVGSLAVAGCGQEVDHPAAAAPCDPATTHCTTGVPLSGSGNDGGSAGGGSSGGDALTTIDGGVIGFADDFFQQGLNFAETAKVSADGRNGSRVTATYDRTSFELDGVLKTAANWFLTEPAANSGYLP